MARIKATPLDLAADARCAPSGTTQHDFSQPIVVREIFESKHYMVKYFSGGRILDSHAGVVQDISYLLGSGFLGRVVGNSSFCVGGCIWVGRTGRLLDFSTWRVSLSSRQREGKAIIDL